MHTVSSTTTPESAVKATLPCSSESSNRFKLQSMVLIFSVGTPVNTRRNGADRTSTK